MVIKTVLLAGLAAQTSAPPIQMSAAPALSAGILPAAAIAPSALFSPNPLDLSPSAGVYERRGVGLLVLDAKDSTKLHLSEGTRRAHSMIREAVDGAEGAASMFDGVVIRRLGDGSLLAFPSYAAALGAAEAIQRENAAGAGPRLRVGVHAGRVLVDATGKVPEIYGRAVEKTLALAAAADGGDIVADGGGSKGVPAPPSRAAGARRPVDSIRVEQAATMFVGLEGWSTAYEQYGRRRSYAAVKTFHAFVIAAIERHGGLVVKTEGETVMASFPSGEAAVKAAADIQGRMADLRAAAPLGSHFRTRVGVSYGRVIREERGGEVDFFGNTVNAAARLMKLAGDGEALISGSTAGQPGAGELLADAPRETTHMKGFEFAIPVHRFKPAPRPRDAAETARLRAIAVKARAVIVPAPDGR